MDVTEILNMILPFAYVIVFIALIWFIIELVFTVRRARSAVNDIQQQLKPTLENVEEITSSIKPIVAKIDPLVERASLTIDAANLEIMRLDQILEDVGEVTDTISSAANAVDAAANAPMELVSNVTSKVRKVFKPRHASPESIALGEKAPDEVQPTVQPVAQPTTQPAQVAQPAQETLGEEVAQAVRQQADQAALEALKQENAASVREAAAQVNQAVQASVGTDTEAPVNRYVTYSFDESKPAGNQEGTPASKSAYEVVNNNNQQG